MEVHCSLSASPAQCIHLPREPGGTGGQAGSTRFPGAQRTEWVSSPFLNPKGRGSLSRSDAQQSGAAQKPAAGCGHRYAAFSRRYSHQTTQRPRASPGEQEPKNSSTSTAGTKISPGCWQRGCSSQQSAVRCRAYHERGPHRSQSPPAPAPKRPPLPHAECCPQALRSLWAERLRPRRPQVSWLLLGGLQQAETSEIYSDKKGRRGESCGNSPSRVLRRISRRPRSGSAQSAGTAAEHRSPPKAGGSTKKRACVLLLPAPRPNPPLGWQLWRREPLAPATRSGEERPRLRLRPPRQPLRCPGDALRSPLPKYTIPYSRPCGVLYSTVKQTSFPISFFRRNSRAGNPQGWKGRSRREPMGQTQPGGSPEPPHPGALALSSTRPALAQDCAGVCLQPTNLQRNPLAGGTPPLSPSVPQKGVTVCLPAGLVLPEHSRTSPGRLLGRGTRAGAAATRGAGAAPTPRDTAGAAPAPVGKERSGTGAAAAPGWEKRALASPQHLPAPRHERTGAPASSAPLHRSGWVGNTVRRREHDVLINN